MKTLLGYKVGMTQIIEADGTVVPVTVIKLGPCHVTQIKTVENDGYDAVQLGFGEVKQSRLTKGQQGHLGLLKSDSKHPKRRDIKGIPAMRHLREVRTSETAGYKLGDVLKVENTFSAGEHVDVIGKTKGRGFTGVVKRHGFSGGPKTHGQSDRLRRPGSIGATSGTARVIKGLRMAGHSGDQKFTSLNLVVAKIDPEMNLLAVKGSVPGPKGGFVVVRSSVKSK